MSTNVEKRPRHMPTLRKAGAGLLLVVAAAIILKIAIGFVIAIFWTVVVVALVVAVLWAIKTIVW